MKCKRSILKWVWLEHPVQFYGIHWTKTSKCQNSHSHISDIQIDNNKYLKQDDKYGRCGGHQ